MDIERLYSPFRNRVKTGDLPLVAYRAIWSTLTFPGFSDLPTVRQGR